MYNPPMEIALLMKIVVLATAAVAIALYAYMYR
jgi:hypothetical protein